MATLPGRNLLKEFEGVMETPSQASGALVKLCELLPNNEDGEAIKTVLARAADHLVPRHQEATDARQVINGNRDARHSIEQSRAQRHQIEMDRRANYDRDYGPPQRAPAARGHSGAISVNNSTP